MNVVFPLQVVTLTCLASTLFVPVSGNIFFRKQPVDVTDHGKGENRSVHFEWLTSDDHHASRNLKCGDTEQVHSKTDKYEECPADCPYFAQNREDAEHCTFLCVKAEGCRKWNPNKPMPDFLKGSKTCRGPRVEFCDEAALDGTDTCVKCQTGYSLFIEDGQCYFAYWRILYVVVAVVGVLFLFIVAWVIDICCRETINPDEFKRAQEFRSRSKVVQPEDLATGRRQHYPIETNLCRQDVAGLGMMLHFNFQAWFILYPLVIAILWSILACFYEELWILGTRKFGTPRHNCILVAWGYETQQGLMWTKVLFLAVVYVFSFIYFLAFAVSQNRVFTAGRKLEKTMSHFTAELRGLPALSGDAGTEDLIKKAVKDSTGKTPVGVSVAWNYGENQDAIEQACKDDQREREEEMGIQDPIPTDTEPPADYPEFRKKMYRYEKALLGPDDVEKLDADGVTAMLKGFVTTDTAFIVFNTEVDKRAAIEKAASEGVKLTVGSESYSLSLADMEQEPDTVNWQNFHKSDFWAMLQRFGYGFCTSYLPALAVWFFLFYVPYAYSCYYFNYDNGAEQPGIYALVFCMIVVGGNATMYFVCDYCCDVIGFRYSDTKQVTYVLFYLAACTINVLLDMYVFYYVCLKMVIGLDFRNYYGKRLSDIDSFTEQFETYAMQRSLGENAYLYAWPSTFLVPFLLEPFITIVIPYQLGKVIIRTHREVSGSCAEAYIAAFDFDMGRYADLLLNVVLGILIFYFPGGYTWTLFYGMFISHIVIYIFDHWRVLNVIPTVKIVSRAVDWWAHVVLAMCCALILSVLVFKANCETYTGYCLKGNNLVLVCSIAGVVHFIVHYLLLVYLVPVIGEANVEDPNPNQEYKEIASREPRSWFSVNPVHCLRSRYIHKHKPYCRFMSVGKGHLLEKNEKICCYFTGKPADTESWDGYKLSDVTDTIKALARATKERALGSGSK